MHGVTRVIRSLGSCSNSLCLRTPIRTASVPWTIQRASVHSDAVNDLPKASLPDGGLDAINELMETSSKAKWMADAAVTLPPQGDLASMGLGGYTPVGLLQTTLDWLHVATGLPWWASIVTCTFILRLSLFPVTVRLQRNAARMNNIRPEMDKIMAKIKVYQQAGNAIMGAQESSKLMALYKEHNCNPLKMIIAPFLQLPIFLSFFIAIRKMASAPVESMKTGGALWFTDLTLPDPYYVLPFAACATFIATIELGGESGVTNPQVEKMKFFFRCMAIMLVPVTASFPTGLFMYWLTSSVFSLSQILILKIPSVRTVFKIPKVVKHPVNTEAGRPGSGLMKQLKDSYRNAMLVDEAKRKDTDAKKRYNTQLETAPTKLYDKPPSKRTQ